MGKGSISRVHCFLEWQQIQLSVYELAIDHIINEAMP